MRIKGQTFKVLLTVSKDNDIFKLQRRKNIVKATVLDNKINL